MAEGGRHPVPVAGGAGRRPGRAAGRHDDGARGKGDFPRADPFDAAVAEGDPCHVRARMDLHELLLEVSPKGPHDIRRVVGNGKDPPPAFDLGLDPAAPEKGEEVVPEEAAEGAVEKTSVRAVHGDEIAEVPGVRQIAAALPADQDLLSRSVGLFEEKDVGAPFRGPPGGHHPARARADHDHASCLFAMVRHIDHRPAPWRRRPLRG